jgi:6-phosphofructokinase 2
MSKVLTITLNPTIDKSTFVKSLIPDQKLRCGEAKFEPGGGGINVSRAIKRLGGDSEAWFLAGGHFGNFFIELIQKKDIKHQAFKIQNETRESLILFDESKQHQYLLDMSGPEVKEEEWQILLKAIEDLNSVEYIVASGSLPPGIPVDFYGRIAKIAKNKGIKFVLDTSGEALKIALNEGVYLCKPNLRELGFLVGSEKMDIENAKIKAKEILDSQKSEVVIVSLGADGALVVTNDCTEHIRPPYAEKKSTVGAGDSMVAGMIFSLSKGKTLSEAFRYGIASGTAATMNAGTTLCKKEDADALYLKIKKI